ncbi:efflux RND transporter periplasmic adaptor subunit [Aquimarina brevivitae]|uniref:RND family efflux transporter MFP subunit n=1 Tax=Aquimarina brevivitae TaxID=323412 RepID=A0A4Q7PGT3_9FLAO|nr:efflux RND transporter periplasmic adaptor subunit [Aquimarina brevivitae]RZS98980.1 RND family efflux transporter MFP subunit [Aquimarina brevivitae]
MKRIVYILVAIAFTVSCGNNEFKSVDKALEKGDLEAIRAQRKEIAAKQQALKEQLKRIDDFIASKDTLKKRPLVTTIVANDTLFTHYLELQGSVETKQNIVLHPEMPGTLTRVFVKEGDKVAKGQTLAKIDDGGLSQQLAQAEVQTELAKTTFERQKRLWEQKIGSEIQYLQAKTAFEAQQNVVAQLKSQLAKTVVSAPFAGVIDNVFSEQGSVVTNMDQIVRIVNLDNMYIETEVPEKYIPNITKGKDVEVYFPVLNETVTTKIRQVGNYINPNNRSFTVEFGIPSKDGSIKPNLTAKVKINDYTKENAILIPQSIISENADGEQYVYVTKSKKGDSTAVAQRVIIQTGKTQGDYIEILQGLANGDEIISEGARSVQNNQEVKIIN